MIYNQGFSEVKIASYDCGSHQLIKELAKKFNFYIFIMHHMMTKLFIQLIF